MASPSSIASTMFPSSHLTWDSGSSGSFCLSAGFVDFSPSVLSFFSSFKVSAECFLLVFLGASLASWEVDSGGLFVGSSSVFCEDDLPGTLFLLFLAGFDSSLVLRSSVVDPLLRTGGVDIILGRLLSVCSSSAAMPEGSIVADRVFLSDIFLGDVAVVPEVDDGFFLTLWWIRERMSSFLQTIPSSMLVRGETFGDPSEDSLEDFLDPSPLRCPSGERSLLTAESLDEFRFFKENLTLLCVEDLLSESSGPPGGVEFTDSFLRPRSNSAEDIVLLKNFEVFQPAALCGLLLVLVSVSEDDVLLEEGAGALASGISLLDVSRRVSLTLKLDGCDALFRGSETTTVVSAGRRGLAGDPRRASRDGDRVRSIVSCCTDIWRTAAIIREAAAAT